MFSDVDAFLRLGGRPRVIAHRGFSGRAPENTLLAFARAIAIGADMIELDVQASRDGELVVIHDETLDRTTNGRGPVLGCDLAELRTLDAGVWFSPEFRGEKIPTLDEVLRLAKGRILVNVEVKGDGVEGVVKAIRMQGMERQTIVSAFDPPTLRRVRAIAPALETASLLNRALHAAVPALRILQEVGSRALNVSDDEVAPALVRECHGGGYAVGVYTVNTLERRDVLSAMGVDAFFTDRPDLLLERAGSGTPEPGSP